MSITLGFAGAEVLSEKTAGRFFGAKEEKRQIPPAFSDLLESASKAVGTDLEDLLFQPVSVSVAGVKECLPTLGNGLAAKQRELWFEASNEDNSFWCRITMLPKTATEFLECALGSTASSCDVPSDRELTDIEGRLAALLADRMRVALIESFEEFGQPSLDLDPCEQVALDEASAPGDLVEAHLKMSLAGEETSLRLFFVSEHLTSLLSGEEESSEAARPMDADWQSHMRGETRQAQIELTAHLKAGSLSLGQINRLQPGETIPLEATTNSLIEVKCNAVPLMNCKIGRSGGSFVLAIEKFLKPSSNAGAKDLAVAFGMMGDDGAGGDGLAPGLANNGGGDWQNA